MPRKAMAHKKQVNNLKEPDDGFVMGSDHLESFNKLQPEYGLSSSYLPSDGNKPSF